MSQDIIRRAAEVVAKNTVQGEAYRGENCVLALIDLEGYPTASVLTPAKADGIKTLWFCTGINSDKVKRIEKCGRASVCFGASDYNVSLVGEIEAVTDVAVKKEMWYRGLENHYSGAEDPNFCVLRFTTKRYNLLVDWQEAKGTL